MICYSIRFLKIQPEKADHVVRSLRQGGLLSELKKQIPGHIGCSILESDLTNDLYLVIDFWQSKYDFFESVLGRMSNQHSTLGPFSFPPSQNDLSEMSTDRKIASDYEVPNKVTEMELIVR